MVDQGLVSAGNFATGVIVARAVGEEAFGVYVLATLLLWFAVDVQRGLALQPVAVLGAALDRSAFRRLLTASLPLQLATILTLAGGVGAVALAWTALRPYALALAVSTGLFQVQEFCRRVLYARAAMGSAIANNVLKYDVQAALLLALSLAGGLTVERAFWIMALTGILATVHGFWQLRPFLAPLVVVPGTAAGELLRIGRWSGLTAALAFVANGAYPALVYQLAGNGSAGAGLAAAAGIGVIWQLLGPVHLVLRPLENYYLPRSAYALSHGGSAAMRRVLLRGTLLTAPPFLAYLAALATVPDLVLGRVYGADFSRHADALRLFALVETLYLPTQLLLLVLQVRRQQHLMFLAELLAAGVIYPAAALLVPSLGLLGAGIAMLLSALSRVGLLAALAAGVSPARPAHQRDASH